MKYKSYAGKLKTSTMTINVREIEMLNRTHNQLLYKKRIQEMRPRRYRMVQVIKSKQGKCIMDKEEVLERWAEFVEELYRDGNRGDADMGYLVNEVQYIQSAVKR